jgi:hypothetical protein
MVVGDGPPQEDDVAQRRVRETRRLVTAQEFGFPVETEFADQNLGLRDRFVSGLSWVFDRVPEVVVLEEDTVPAPSFFDFCDTLLDRYRGDQRVFDITGRNPFAHWETNADYHFSFQGSIWGWASWRNSWQEYDPDMTAWVDPDVREAVGDLFEQASISRYVRWLYDRTYEGEIDTWDYQWGFARQRVGGLSAVPSQNLIQNVGFGNRATNTSRSHSRLVEIGTCTLPLSHPDEVQPDHSYETRLHKRRPDRWRGFPGVRSIADALDL